MKARTSGAFAMGTHRAQLTPLLVGSSWVMRAVRARLDRLAQLPWPVRIEGPTGSGKGVAARLLHLQSPRREAPFVALPVTMLSEGLELGQLVGHARGAYTGAVVDRAGDVEAAHRGTLFLDEIGVATSRVQLVLLQLLEGEGIRRLGEQHVRLVDVRIVVATNVALARAVLDGTFRSDLYHRLGKLVLRMPALAQHPTDIPEIARHLLRCKSQDVEWPIPPLGPAELAVLLAYPWPGNVRELDSVLSHYAAFGELPDAVVRARRSRDWRDRIDAALCRNGGNKTWAARELGISRKTLHEELRARRLDGDVQSCNVTAPTL